MVPIESVPTLLVIAAFVAGIIFRKAIKELAEALAEEIKWRRWW